jgi:4,5-DOPA dioxygenase extradiol
MYPRADIPVFQLSIDYDRPGEYHYAIGRELAALRDKGVLIMGSGNIVHNLRALDRGAADGLQASRPWADAFDTVVKKALEGRDDKRLINYLSLDSTTMAVPTPDHYFPFLYTLGAAGELEEAQSIFEGFQAGTLSMRCVQFGT